MKTALVTGGAGFLGSHLCEKLLNSGNAVICLDNLFTGKKSNIQHLLNNPEFKFILGDVTDPLNFDADQIYNLACPASPPHYQFDSIKTIKTGVIGAINVLELAEKNKARVLQTSTSEVYGDPQIHPQREDYWGYVNPIGVRSCYDEGKRLAETLFFEYHKNRDVDIRVVRIFNTYGERMSPDDGRVVSNFIVQALLNKDITIYGDGTQTRSFCYVDDLIDGILKMMNTPNITGPINLGNPEEFTVLELAEKVIRLTNSSSKIVYKPLPENDPNRRRPDITRAKKFLDWQPKIRLDEGLMKTINYFRGRIFD